MGRYSGPPLSAVDRHSGPPLPREQAATLPQRKSGEPLMLMQGQARRASVDKRATETKSGRPLGDMRSPESQRASRASNAIRLRCREGDR